MLVGNPLNTLQIGKPSKNIFFSDVKNYNCFTCVTERDIMWQNIVAQTLNLEFRLGLLFEKLYDLKKVT